MRLPHVRPARLPRRSLIAACALLLCAAPSSAQVDDPPSFRVAVPRPDTTGRATPRVSIRHSEAVARYVEIRAPLLGPAQEPRTGYHEAHSGVALGSELAWNTLPAPNIDGRTAMLDARHDRLIAFNDEYEFGTLKPQRVWQLPLVHGGSWSEIVTEGESPFPRAGLVAVLDTRRDRILVYGGTQEYVEGNYYRNRYFDGVWTLPLSGAPVWTKLPIAGPTPPLRTNASAIYDPGHGALVIWGGWSGGTLLNDTWKLSLSDQDSSSWRPLAVSGERPEPRYGASIAYDPPRQRMLLMSGSDLKGSYHDLWALALEEPSVWTRIPASGLSAPGRVGHSLTYDPTGDRLILFSGASDYPTYPLSDLWELPLSVAPEWRLLFPGGDSPGFHAGHAAIYDAARDRIIVTGGSLAADTWQLALDGAPSWSLLAGSRALPDPRQDAVAVYDSQRGRVVIFGGFRRGETYDESYLESDLHWLPVAGAAEWRGPGYGGAGPLPAARSAHTAVYDPRGDRMIVFGGSVEGDLTWRLQGNLLAATFSGNDGVSWSALDVHGDQPPNSYFANSIYDPDGERMIIYGGTLQPGDGDVWSLSLSGVPRWTRWHPAGDGPGGRRAAGVAYDPRGHRMLVFGGYDGSRIRGDTWSLSLGEHPEWTRVIGETDARLARTFPSAAYDPSRKRLVIWGGHALGTNLPANDAWELDLSGPPRWREMEVSNEAPEAREEQATAFDAEAGRLIVFGGFRLYHRDPNLNDTWVLPLSPRGRQGGHEDVAEALAADEPAGEATPVAIGHAHPNPSAGETAITFTLAEPEHLLVAVHDLAGRRVCTLADARFALGPQRLTWDGRDASGRAVAAGVYFVRLEVAGVIQSRRIVRVP